MQLQIELRGLRLIEVQAAMRTKVEAKQVRFQQQWMFLRSLNLALIDMFLLPCLSRGLVHAVVPLCCFQATCACSPAGGDLAHE